MSLRRGFYQAGPAQSSRCAPDPGQTERPTNETRDERPRPPHPVQHQPPNRTYAHQGDIDADRSSHLPGTPLRSVRLSSSSVGASATVGQRATMWVARRGGMRRTADAGPHSRTCQACVPHSMTRTHSARISHESPGFRPVSSRLRMHNQLLTDAGLGGGGRSEPVVPPSLTSTPVAHLATNPITATTVTATTVTATPITRGHLPLEIDCPRYVVPPQRPWPGHGTNPGQAVGSTRAAPSDQVDSSSPFITTTTRVTEPSSGKSTSCTFAWEPPSFRMTLRAAVSSSTAR